MTSVTKREDDTAGAGRFLVRALVVVGGAAAVSTVAWLTATASASTQVPDGPIESGSPAAVAMAGHREPPVPSPVAGVVPALSRDLHDAAAAPRAAHDVPSLLRESAHVAVPADVVSAGVDRVKSSLAAGVEASRSIATAATDLTGTSPQPDFLRDPVSEASVAPRPDIEQGGVTPTPAADVLAARTADAHSSGIRVHATSADMSPSTRAHDHRRPGHNTGDQPVHPWSPSCVVSASTCLATDHGHGSGDAAHQAVAEPRLLPHACCGLRDHIVTAAELCPGVTPD
jgi:hypothetical protein